MANVTASMENVAKTTLWQSNESSYLKVLEILILLHLLVLYAWTGPPRLIEFHLVENHRYLCLVLSQNVQPLTRKFYTISTGSRSKILCGMEMHGGIMIKSDYFSTFEGKIYNYLE